MLAKALELYTAAVKQGHFRSPRAAGSGAGAPAPGDGGNRSPASAGSPSAALAAAGFGDAAGGARGRGELNLHALTAGVAMLSLYLWMGDLRDTVFARGEGALPATLAIVTDAGNASKEQVGRGLG